MKIFHIALWGTNNQANLADCKNGHINVEDNFERDGDRDKNCFNSLTVRYPCESFTQPITTSLPAILPFPEEIPNPTHPVVAASTASETDSLCQLTVQYRLIRPLGSNTARWAYSLDRSAAQAEEKAENTISSDLNMFVAEEVQTFISLSQHSIPLLHHEPL